MGGGGFGTIYMGEYAAEVSTSTTYYVALAGSTGAMTGGLTRKTRKSLAGNFTGYGGVFYPLPSYLPYLFNTVARGLKAVTRLVVN